MPGPAAVARAAMASCQVPAVGGASDAEYDGGVIVSSGVRSARFTQLLKLLPEAANVVVDVKEWLHAPRRADRIHASYPNPQIIKQVRAGKGFVPCVTHCENVLRQKGVVVVVCKGGNHRAPTVAAELSSAKRHVVHLTMDDVSVEDVAVLVGSCIGDGRLSTQLCESAGGQNNFGPWTCCIGWEWCWTRSGTRWSLASDPLEFGTLIHHVTPSDTSGCVIVHTVDGRTATVDTRWVIPEDIYMLYVYRQLANAPLRM